MQAVLQFVQAHWVEFALGALTLSAYLLPSPKQQRIIKELKDVVDAVKAAE